MNTLCIVPCGRKKIWDKYPDAGPTEARRVYIGSFAKKCIEYAERFYPQNYRILSAKYGLLKPDTVISENYNITFKDAGSHPITIDELKLQARQDKLHVYERIVVMGGADYAKRATMIFSTIIYRPLAECKGIGYMLQRLNQALSKATPL